MTPPRRKGNRKDISVRSETYAKLAAHAKVTGRTPGELTEELILAFLDAHPAPDKPTQ